MNKKKLETEMKNAPLRYPYADWNWLRQLPPDIMHFIAFDFASPEHPLYKDAAALLGEDFLASHIPEFLQQRWLAVKQYNEWERDYTQNGTKRMGIPIDKSLRSKMRNGMRYFAVPNEKIEYITNLMGKSAHFVLFGEEQPFVLPEPANSIIKYAIQFGDEFTIRLAAEARITEKAFIKNTNKDEKPEGHYYTQNELYRTRMSWYMDVNRLRSPFIFGVGKTPNQLKTAIPKIYGEEALVPQLQLLCETALITQIPLDFFVCSVFSTKRIKCMVTDDEGKQSEVTDDDLKRYLEALFTVSEPYRYELLTKSWQMIFKEIGVQ